ncbi:phytanoyl-CoA dioxygenase family protein [Biscogniauxia mediterranea]|nr:phytanoyl-CoA dioxygenase family protein [Biscogniauxia mediterranea]
MADPSPLRDELAKSGFVIQRALLTPSELATLRAAASRTTALARSGGWPDVRTVGKQFPPWTAGDAASLEGGGGIWGVQGLLHPSLPDAPVFARAYFGDATLGVAKELLGPGCGDADLVMELFNLLVRPGRDFALRWHRDDVPDEADEAEEEARLGDGKGRPRSHTQWNLALYPDASLVVVPGSHARARTAAERAAGPDADHLPGELAVELGAGDAVFYDNNILHRGTYEAGRERMTLHGSVGRAGAGPLRARNVLQHGVGAWVGRCDFSGLGGEGERIRRRAEGMRERLVKLGRESGDVGYSLTG